MSLCDSPYPYCSSGPVQADNNSDLNTRYSGIEPGQLEEAAMDLEGVRATASMFIGPDTIVVGHG
jgi:hypothetical protein